ncbi:MAG: hypothetical protein IKC51_02690, partial [Myxococcaceae bacterium]|nr:hypothetical protein [Myxococcaceae bacterium]
LPPSPPAPLKYTSGKLKSANHSGEPVWGVFWEEFRGELNNCRAFKRENQQLPRAEADLNCRALKHKKQRSALKRFEVGARVKRIVLRGARVETRLFDIENTSLNSETASLIVEAQK